MWSHSVTQVILNRIYIRILSSFEPIPPGSVTRVCCSLELEDYDMSSGEHSESEDKYYIGDVFISVKHFSINKNSQRAAGRVSWL